jgi:hypothetical protein
MLIKTEALVLHKVPHSDHSAVVKLFTKDCGLLSFLVQGLHGKHNKNAYYQPGQFLEIIFHRKSGPGLHRIREVQAQHTGTASENPADEFWKQQLLSFAVELSSHCLSEEHSEPELFEALSSNIRALNQGEVHHTWFPLQLCLDIAECMGQSLPLREAQRKGGLDIANGHFGQANSLPHHLLSERDCSLLWEAHGSGNWEATRGERLAILDKLVMHLSVSFFPGKTLKSISIIREMASVH